MLQVTNVSLQYGSKKLFEGLEVSKDKALCSVWQNQWPVLFLTLKSVEGLKFDSAYGMLEAVVSELCVEHYYLAESQAVNPIHREIFLRLAKKEASEEEVKNSLYTLLAMMHVYYGKQVILLVDEYDVPLAKEGMDLFPFLLRDSPHVVTFTARARAMSVKASRDSSKSEEIHSFIIPIIPLVQKI